MAAAKTPLELVRPVFREMALRSELAKITYELESVKLQSREAINKSEKKQDGKQLQDLLNVMRTLKTCYREAREEIQYLRSILREYTDQVIQYKGMYLKTRQDFEEQKMLLESQDMDNIRISEQINLEILTIRKTFEERLRDLEQYPDLLKETEAMLMQEREKKAKAEHAVEMLTIDLNIARERIHILMHTIVQVPEETEDDILKKKADELNKQKIATLNNHIEKLKLEIERLKSKLIFIEEKSLHDERRLLEKFHDCVVLGAEVDQTRLESNTALVRLTKRYEVARRNMEIKIKDLEYKLEVAKNKIISSEKQKERVEQEMEMKLHHFKEVSELAEQRIMNLTAKVQELQRTRVDDVVIEEEPKVCNCKTVFQNP